MIHAKTKIPTNVVRFLVQRKTWNNKNLVHFHAQSGQSVPQNWVSENTNACVSTDVVHDQRPSKKQMRHVKEIASHNHVITSHNDMKTNRVNYEILGIHNVWVSQLRK